LTVLKVNLVFHPVFDEEIGTEFRASGLPLDSVEHLRACVKYRIKIRYRLLWYRLPSGAICLGVPREEVRKFEFDTALARLQQAVDKQRGRVVPDTDDYTFDEELLQERYTHRYGFPDDFEVRENAYQVVRFQGEVKKNAVE